MHTFTGCVCGWIKCEKTKVTAATTKLFAVPVGISDTLARAPEGIGPGLVDSLTLRAIGNGDGVCEWVFLCFVRYVLERPSSDEGASSVRDTQLNDRPHRPTFRIMN